MLGSVTHWTWFCRAIRWGSPGPFLLLLGFDVIYWSLCGVLFPFAIEAGG